MPKKLTERQIEILKLAANGMTSNEIALELNIKPRTVAMHLNAIRTSLGANNQAHAVLLAYRLGYFAHEGQGAFDLCDSGDEIRRRVLAEIDDFAAHVLTCRNCRVKH